MFRLQTIWQAALNQKDTIALALPGRYVSPGHNLNFSGPVFPLPERNTLPLQRISLNYAQNLEKNGFTHPELLKPQLQRWLNIFESFQPDCIIAEHAPSALLAARKFHLACRVTGTGFSIPPALTPMPTLQPWFNISAQQRLKLEQAVVGQMNITLQNLGIPALDSMADLFSGHTSFLCTFPELDHYTERGAGSYYGPVLSTAEAACPLPPHWKRHAFIYLNAGNPSLQTILTELRERGIPTLAFIPDISAEQSESLTHSGLIITRSPVNLHQLKNTCAFMVSQGGHNAGAFMLLQGIPLFICPQQLEQTLWGHQLARRSLAMMVNPYQPGKSLPNLLSQFIRSDKIVETTLAFASKYTAHHHEDLVSQLIN